MLSTILLTDIVGSTDLLARMGEQRWRDVLESHDAAAQRQVERFRGRRIKATGDGLLAMFDGPARAVLCASAIREEAGRLGLAIRAGIHTGEVAMRGEDVSGMTVHIAARVEALAQPAEILTSRTVAAVRRGSLRFPVTERAGCVRPPREVREASPVILVGHLRASRYPYLKTMVRRRSWMFPRR